jgi:hypothetical protein
MEVNLSLDHHFAPTNLLEMLYAPVDVVLKQLKVILAAQSQLKEIYIILLLFCLLY